jgi:hypothetical protein
VGAVVVAAVCGTPGVLPVASVVPGCPAAAAFMPRPFPPGAFAALTPAIFPRTPAAIMSRIVRIPVTQGMAAFFVVTPLESVAVRQPSMLLSDVLKNVNFTVGS